MQKWECPCSFVYDQLKNITMWWVGEKRKINIACHNLQSKNQYCLPQSTV
jgi:hypothetical protein